MPPTALFSTMPPHTSMPGTACMVSAARLAVSLMWFLMTKPRMPRALASVARSMSSMLRPNTSGCECACMSMTPMAGLTFGGGGGNAAWPKTCAAKKMPETNAIVFIGTSLSAIIRWSHEKNPSSRPCLRCSNGACANLSHETNSLHRPVPAGRRHRHQFARADAAHRQEHRLDLRRRQQAGRGRQHRRRAGGQGAARRLHAGAGPDQQPRDQSLPLRQAALRPDEGFRAGGAGELGATGDCFECTQEGC